MMSNRSSSRSQITKRAKYYERLFDKVCERGLAHVIKIHDGGETFSNGKMTIRNGSLKPNFTFVRKKQPFDRLVIFGRKILACDIKTKQKNSITYSEINSKKGFLKEHQRDALNKFSQAGISGIIVFHLNINATVFYSNDILNCLKPRKSIGLKDGLLLGDLTNFEIDPIFQQD